MAASPRFKVYNDDGKYEAACHQPEAAAAIVAGIGRDGWTIRDGHQERHTVWHEGLEDQPAGESYDMVAETVWERLEARRQEQAAKRR